MMMGNEGVGVAVVVLGEERQTHSRRVADFKIQPTSDLPYLPFGQDEWQDSVLK